MPVWPLIAVICGFLHLVPFIGAVLALAIAGMVMLFANADAYRMLGVLGVYVFAQALEGFYLTPKILGSRLRMPPWVVFVTILIGGALFGPLGILLAAPVTAILLLAWRKFARHQ
jgi:predicted PurR-regulated permease PerM